MLSKNLKVYRRACGFNQEDVAKVLGIDRSAYSYYESGKTEPSVKNLIKIARMFKVDVDTLVGSAEHPAVVQVATKAAEFNEGKFSEFENLGKCSPEERRLIAWFRQLDDKDAVLNILKKQFMAQEETE